jgi:hypothetical protein
MSVSKENFSTKIEHVGENLYLSHFHLKIHEKMTVMLNERRDEYPDFFGWSRMAHYETGVLRLTRAYDGDNLGLLKAVKIFQSNYRFWGLLGINEHPLNQEIEEDKVFLTQDSLVKKLVHLRNKAIAHTDNQLYPKKPGFNVSEIFGGSLMYKKGRLTTQEIESLPENERDKFLMQKHIEIFQALDDDRNKILGQEIPSFDQLYDLTKKGVDICNKYMVKLGIPSIDLRLEGID